MGLDVTGVQTGMREAQIEKRGVKSGAHVLRIGKRHIAFGLLWAKLPGVGRTGKEIRQLAEDHDANDYVSLKIGDRHVLIGLLPKTVVIEKGAKKSAALSAAGMLTAKLGASITNALFAFRLKNRIAIIGFRNGMPLVGFDVVVAEKDVAGVVADFLKLLGEDAPSVQFFGDAKAFAGRHPEPIDLPWFANVDIKKAGLSTLKRVKQPVGLIVGAVVFAAVAIGGLQYYEHYQEEEVKRQRTVNIDPNIEYSRSVSTVLAAAGYPALTLASQIIDVVNRLPMYHQGWRLQLASCSPGQCVLTWTNDDGGTYQSFAAAPLAGGRMEKITYREGLTGLDMVLQFPMQGQQGVKADVLPSADRFVLDFGARAQQMKEAGLTVTMEKANIVGLPPVRPGQPPVTENVLKDPIKEGRWTLTGDWMFYEALTYLPPNMTIDKFDVAVSAGAISMTIGGKYYVKK